MDTLNAVLRGGEAHQNIRKKARSSITSGAPAVAKQRVVVIGAGFSGLGAASTLSSSNNIDVVVLEASDAVGGRARLGKLPSGVPVELGATWFHGIQNNILYDLAVWQGVAKDLRGDPDVNKHEIDWQLHFARPLEKQLLDGRSKEVALEAVYHFTEAAEECIEDEAISAPSVGTLLRQRFDKEVMERGLEGEELATYAASWWFREKMQRTFDGFWSTDDVSLAFPREFETLDGPNMPVPGGYQALAELLTKECNLDVRYGHRVRSIEWSTGDAYGEGAGARVTCTNGMVFEADAVLVTLSIGVLQANHEELFQPPLPDCKVAAMSAVRLGVADKIFVEFEVDPELEAAQQQQQQQQGGRPQTPGAVPTAPAPPAMVQSAAACAAAANQLAQPQASAQGAGSSTSNGEQVQVVQGGQPEPWNMGRKPSCSSLALLVAVGAQPSMDGDSLQGDQDRAPVSCQSDYTGTDPAYIASLPRQAQEGPGTDGFNSSARDSGTPVLQPQQQQHLHVPDAAAAALAALAVHSAPNTCNGVHGLGSLALPTNEQLSALQTALGNSDNSAPLGRRPNSLDQTTSTSTSYPPSTGTGSQPLTQLQPQQQQRRGRGRGRNRQVIHSYAFLWPVEEPLEMGMQGSSKALSLLPGGLPLPPPPRNLMGNVPRWCLGLHSIRFSPGPEWVQPSELHRAWRNSQSQQQQAWTATSGQQRKTTSAVLWITGEAAMEMEALSEQQVQEGVVALLQAFPQIPLPPGAVLPPTIVRTKWGTDELHRGSYSYCCATAGEHAGDAVDALAEPLCTATGVPVVMFAGEATHRQYMGTVHGAFASGIREAERLRDALENMEAQAAWRMGMAAAGSAQAGMGFAARVAAGGPGGPGGLSCDHAMAEVGAYHI